MIRRSFTFLTLVALAVVAMACASPAPSATPDSPAPSPVSFELRTFPWAQEVDGTPVGCDTIGVTDPVFGHLAGALPIDSTDPIWLEAPDGTRLSIVWPEGFTLVFEPTPVIYDQAGAVVARLRDAIMLQVPRTAAAGTFEDPYVASGILLAGSFTAEDVSNGVAYQGCFPRAEDAGAATWWVDPAADALSPETTVVPAVLMEQECASGQSPEGRVLKPVIEYRADAVVVTISVTRVTGAAECPSNPEFPLEITLSEPLGTRTLLDGGSTPPRDATTLP